MEQDVSLIRGILENENLSLYLLCTRARSESMKSGKKAYQLICHQKGISGSSVIKAGQRTCGGEGGEKGNDVLTGAHWEVC